MKIAIIAEKPSVAREIASIVGATSKTDGFLQGNNYQVTWAFGHLIQLAMPEEYGAIGFDKAHLPIIPNEFILKSRLVKADKGYKEDAGALKQLKVIESVFDSCDKIIVATDAGREGELIFRYIYNFLGCTKPFDRLWISSLTEKSIQQGLNNLKAGTDYDKLYYAAKTRSEADWLVGINASQALSIAAGKGVYSLGRVQTPTLAMICSRYLENKNFVSSKYWQHQLKLSSNGGTLLTNSIEKYNEKSQAESIAKTIQEKGKVLVKSVERKTIQQEAPLLYDLTTLQKEANTKHGFSADKTLSIAQKLYEAKVTTYPRTGSRYISEDVFEAIPELLGKLSSHPIASNFVSQFTELNKYSVDDKKITDHHAIIVTENQAKDLSRDENTIYSMIVGRMIESFMPKCVKDQINITFQVDVFPFSSKGSIIKEKGWRAVFSEKTSEEEEEQELPDLKEGEILDIASIEVLEKQTKPKALHTEASLLSAMETAGKDLENEEQRQAMKTSGLGTPATRASIIETLFARDYIRREKKTLIPTEKGLAVYEVVKDKQIADVELTGMWEDAFMKIETGSVDADNFKKSIEVYATQITAELLQTDIATNEQQATDCPKCKGHTLRLYPKVAKCSNETCAFTVFRNICGKTLTDAQLSDLLVKGKTNLIKGLKSKAGKQFDASLYLDEEFQVKFVFLPNRQNQK